MYNDKKDDKITLEDFEFNCIVVSDETLFIRLNNLMNDKRRNSNPRMSYFIPAMIQIVINELRYRDLL